MTHNHPSPIRSHRRILATSLWISSLILSLLLLPSAAYAASASPILQDEQAPDAVDQRAWLEPRGLNIVDLVGLVPDADLRGGIINYETGTGMLIYQSGSRSGNTVTINTSVIPRYFTHGQTTFTQIPCLSQHAAWDQMLSPAPASTVVITSGGRNLNGQIIALSTAPAGQVLPSGNPGDYLRYPRGATNNVSPADQFPLPANNGCALILQGRYTNITATFRANAPQQISVTRLGAQTFNARSYIGTGNAGILSSLNSQMSRRFGSRHDKWTMRIPEGADYVLVNFPPQTIDPYASEGNPANAGVAGTGSYRFEGNGLSVDHVNMMGLPLAGQWRDADQAGSSEFLPYIANPTRFTAPEIFVPAGFAYDPCMTNGGCPESLLDRLHGHTFPVTLTYIRVDRLPGSALQRIPVNAVGKGWSAAATGSVDPGEADSPTAFATPDFDALFAEAADAVPPSEEVLMAASSEEVNEIMQQGNRIYLPNISNPNPPAPPPPDAPTGCPCGWFDSTGRMYDFIPRP